MHLPMLEILHHLLKNHMVSGNSTLNTGLKTSREEFPASQRTAFLSGEQGALGCLFKAGSNSGSDRRQPMGFGGLTTPPKGCHSVKALLVLGNVSTGKGRLQQTNKQAGRGDARL